MTVVAIKNQKRSLSGVLLFDKSMGFSSNQALQIVKRLYRAEKTGHTGTLDPLASGLLPLMFGEATKFAADLIDASKTYRTTISLGYASSTGDAEGELTQVSTRALESITDEEVKQVCAQFVGEIQQTPPMFSALKKDGKPLYEYAREGIELDRAARTILIHQLDVIKLEHNENNGESNCTIELDVNCSKGTYVRTLGEDIAKALGTAGYLTKLRRTAIGDLKVERAYTLEALKVLGESENPFDALDAVLFPVDALLGSLGKVELNNEFARRFSHGQRLPLELANAKPGRMRVYGEALAQDVNTGVSNTAPQGTPQFMGTGILETDGKGALLRPDRLIQVNL
ncbi:MAG: tRNA pseudouridine(55) synthase TruB [Gammaproteobacteria bacterium]|nr:tRNA pseudouridine(55) synthase TruB [Gammaproteobacteria bacterium]